jgi:4-amino-4-deoxy-L-arabinose transferase-like glycosyltransferase
VTGLARAYRSDPQRAAKVAALVLVGLALMIRVAVVVMTPDLEIRADAADYQRHSVSLASGEGYPPSVRSPGATAWRPPGLPLFLGGVYWVLGESVVAARLVQAILGTLGVALIGYVTFQLWGRRAGLAALGLAAVYPPMILFGASLFAEPLFIALEVGAVAAVIQHRRSEHRYRWALLAGALAGAAALTRSNGLWVILPLAVGAIPWRPWSWRASLPAVAVIGACAVVVAPWTARNAIALDAFVPVTTQVGEGLSGTYNDSARNDPVQPAAWRAPRLDPRLRSILAGETSSEVQLDRRLRSEVRDFVFAHPSYVAETGLRNTLRMLHLDGWAYSRGAARSAGLPGWPGDLAVYGWWMVSLAAIVGAVGMLAGGLARPPPFFWLIPALFATVIFMSPITRHRLAIDPFVLMLAGVGLAWAAGVFGHRRVEARAGARGDSEQIAV